MKSYYIFTKSCSSYFKAFEMTPNLKNQVFHWLRDFVNVQHLPEDPISAIYESGYRYIQNSDLEDPNLESFLNGFLSEWHSGMTSNQTLYIFGKERENKMQDVRFNWTSDESTILKSLKLVECIQFSLEQYRKTVLSHHVPCSGRCTQLENAENAMKQLQALLPPIQGSGFVRG